MKGELHFIAGDLDKGALNEWAAEGLALLERRLEAEARMDAIDSDGDAP